jgi:multiple sugar transport system ATP-binding protein
MATVLIRDVRKAFGAMHVIHGVDISIGDGEFVVLVGPSGCGKSTLLRMIAGLENITAGEIRIGDRVVNNVPPKERDIAMVFQNYALYPHMTVAANMAFSLKLRGAGKQEIDTRVNRAAEILGLMPLLERFPRQLSGGQRQRVAMGRAIVRDPRSSCSTSRCPISTPSCACRCAPRSRSCTSGSRPPPSTSPTIRSRP